MSDALSCRFRPEHRLLTGKEFQAVFDNPVCKVAQPPFLMLIRFNGRAAPRIGFVIARKKVRLAVDRNRVKRLVRDNFRHQRHQLPNVDIVFVARQGIDELSNEVLCAQLVKAWNLLLRRCQAAQASGASL